MAACRSFYTFTKIELHISAIHLPLPGHGISRKDIRYPCPIPLRYSIALHPQECRRLGNKGFARSRRHQPLQTVLFSLPSYGHCRFFSDLLLDRRRRSGPDDAAPMAVFSRPIGGIAGVAPFGDLAQSQAGIGHYREELWVRGKELPPILAAGRMASSLVRRRPM